jgi:Phosphoenolpyruvate synthase/pyruvate phosphate dikinase
MAIRENGKTPIVRVFDDTRRLLAAVTPALVDAGVLGGPADIHFLRYQELRQVLRGEPGPGVAELERRRIGARAVPRTGPARARRGGPRLAPTPRRRLLRRAWPAPAGGVGHDHRHADGHGRQPGAVTATARVLLDPFDDFEPGDILFAKTVDPGWAPVLSCAGAVVLDIGGVMSHGAVVARELGIPCVVNVKAGTGSCGPAPPSPSTAQPARFSFFNKAVQAGEVFAPQPTG